MPHSKPPFWTTLFEGLGAQVAAVVEAAWEADEEVGGDAGEEAEVGIESAAGEDTAVTADEGGVDEEGGIDEEDEDEEDTAEVAGGIGLEDETDPGGDPGGLLYLNVERTHQLSLYSRSHSFNEICFIFLSFFFSFC